MVSLAVGCAGSAPIGLEGALKPSRQPHEPDIPLPEGFRLVERSCEDWSSGPIRYLRHRYRGRAEKAAVRRFYRQQMPLVRWKAISDGNVHGRYTMRFERRTESCTITIEDATLGLSSRVVVDVLIAPAARQSTEYERTNTKNTP